MVTGPAKVLSARAGRKFELSINCWFTDVDQMDPPTGITEFLADILLNRVSAEGGIEAPAPREGLALINNVCGIPFAAVENFVNNTFFTTNHTVVLEA